MGFSAEEIYEAYFEKVYKTAFYILKNEETAKDATQVTFMKAFNNLNKIKDMSKLEPWLITISTRTAIDFYRKNKKQNSIEFSEEIYQPEIKLSNENEEQIESSLERLAPEQKQILVLKYFEGLSEKEIAKLLKIKVGTVKSRLFRAKKSLLAQFVSGGVKNG